MNLYVLFVEWVGFLLSTLTAKARSASKTDPAPPAIDLYPKPLTPKLVPCWFTIY